MNYKNGNSSVVLFESDSLPDLLRSVAEWVEHNTSAYIWEIIVQSKGENGDSEKLNFAWIYHTGSWNIK
jgi:serine protease inhibitor